MERRYLQLDQPIEIREEEGSPPSIRGYAAVFYRSSDPGTEFEVMEGVKERIDAGAFNRAITESHDVAALMNHDPNMLLGRSSAGTLKLETNRRGLLYEISLPDTSVGRDVHESVRRGDLKGSSFAFRVTGERWSTGEQGEVREITDVTLIDVGPVTHPAYKATTAGLRDEDLAECRTSLGLWKEHLQIERDALEMEWEHALVQAKLNQL